MGRGEPTKHLQEAGSLLTLFMKSSPSIIVLLPSFTDDESGIQTKTKVTVLISDSSSTGVCHSKPQLSDSTWPHSGPRKSS